ncbi:MAG: type II toxin-antitoxin system prevent-host-death family antitoxin [Candidatus Aminicenantes bacterium]|nr:type II toxin-antitoxin system prevent-host-death family antitoxin [Candidatus Aminicenantes bacterium]
METISYTTARKTLAKTMERVCHDHSPVMITRQTAEPVVLLSLDDYHALEETAYLMHSSKNAARLTQAIEEIEAGSAKERKLLE